MRIRLQLLTPSMQHAEEADLRPEMLGIASDFEQGFSTGKEEQAVEELLVLQGEGRQPMRKGEDEVGVRGGQDFPAARLNPTVASVGLALGAVSIAAANGDHPIMQRIFSAAVAADEVSEMDRKASRDRCAKNRLD